MARVVLARADIDVAANRLTLAGVVFGAPGEAGSLRATFAGRVREEAWTADAAGASVFEIELDVGGAAVHPIPPARVELLGDGEAAVAVRPVADRTAPAVHIASARLDLTTGQLETTGVVLGWRKGDLVWTTLGGKPVGRLSFLPGGHPQFPWASPRARIQCRMAVKIQPPDFTPLGLTIEVVRGDVIVAARRVMLDRGRGLTGSRPQRLADGSAPRGRVGARLPRLLARWAGREGRRALLDSAELAQAWRRGPRTFARALCQAAVEEGVKRGEFEGPLPIRLESGDSIVADPSRDFVIARRFLLDGQYEGGLIAWICANLPRGGVFLDVGACYGHIGLAASRAVGPGGLVVAIEASKTSAARLRGNIQRNGAANVKLLNVAVGASAGTVKFAEHQSGNIGGNRLAWPSLTATAEAAGALVSTLTVVDLRSGGPRQMNAAEAETQTVRMISTPMRTLDDIAAEIGRPVDLMKMDIEGAELQALLGAQGLLDGAYGSPPIVTLEYSSLFPIFGGVRADIFEQFSRRGWSAYRFARSKAGGGMLKPIRDDSEAPEHDNIVFCPPGRTVSNV